MTQILFVHSAGSQAEGEGSSMLLKGLSLALGSDLHLHAPMMPNPDSPAAEPWITACHAEIDKLGPELVIIGHSLGGSIALQTLGRFGFPEGLLGVVTLASPFWGAPEWEFEDFAIPRKDVGKLFDLPRLIMVQGDDDEVVGSDHLDRYKNLLPNADIRRIPGVDHEAGNAGPVLASIVDEITKHRA